MKKKILSLVLCLSMLFACMAGFAMVKDANASQASATVIVGNMVKEYPGDFGTAENTTRNKLVFNLTGLDLKKGQYVSFTLDAHQPVDQFGLLYSCNGNYSNKYLTWFDKNPGKIRTCVQIPHDSNWLDIQIYTNINVPKGTEISLSNVTVSNTCGDYCGVRRGNGTVEIQKSMIPFSAKKGDAITFDVELVNAVIPNAGGVNTKVWFWQNTNSDKSKIVNTNVYTTPEGVQRAELVLTEDLTNFFVTVGASGVPNNEVVVATISNVTISDKLHDDGRIVDFNFADYEECTIDGNNLYFTMAAGTDVTNLAPTFKIASDARVDKTSGSSQNFTNPVTYTVTSRMGHKSTYTVYVYALDNLPQASEQAAQAIVDRANALPDKIWAVDTQILDEAIALKTDYEALSILEKMLIPQDLKDKIAQAAKKAEDVTKPIRITCVGDSITQGVGAENQDTQSYPAQLQNILGDGYEVKNAGVSGAEVLSGSSKPYNTTSRYQEGIDFAPNVVILMLGTNDAYGTRCTTPAKIAQFEQDYRALVDVYRSLDTNPKIFLALPPSSYGSSDSIQSNLTNIINPLIATFAEEEGLELIDMNAFTSNHADWFPDALHPSADGYVEFAKEFAKYIRRYASTELASVSVSDIEITHYDEDTNTYQMTMPDTSYLSTVKATPVSQDADIQIQMTGTELPTSATVTVTSGDGRARKTYTIDIKQGALPKQEEEQDEKNDNADKNTQQNQSQGSVQKSPATGDASHTVVWLLLCFFGIVIMIVTLRNYLSDNNKRR